MILKILMQVLIKNLSFDRFCPLCCPKPVLDGRFKPGFNRGLNRECPKPANPGPPPGLEISGSASGEAEVFFIKIYLPKHLVEPYLVGLSHSGCPLAPLLS